MIFFSGPMTTFPAISNSRFICMSEIFQKDWTNSLTRMTVIRNVHMLNQRGTCKLSLPPDAYDCIYYLWSTSLLLVLKFPNKPLICVRPLSYCNQKWTDTQPDACVWLLFTSLVLLLKFPNKLQLCARPLQTPMPDCLCPRCLWKTRKSHCRGRIKFHQ